MIGQMNQVITVYTASFATDGYGGRIETLTPLAGNYFAKVEHLSGEEREHAGREALKSFYAFTMHNFYGFPATTTSQIEWNGLKFDVVDREFSGGERLFVTFKTVAGELNG